MAGNLEVVLDSKRRLGPPLGPHFYPRVVDWRTNARLDTGKNVKISSKGFAIPTEKSSAKRITKGNVIPTGNKNAINSTKMSNKSIKTKSAKMNRSGNAKSIGKKAMMGPKIGWTIPLLAKLYMRPNATRW